MKLPQAQLKAFLQLAETSSFTDAASTLGVSQPTLSRTIQQMETAIGARLFSRDTRRIVLTTVGVELLPIVRGLLHEVEAAERDIAQVVSGERGRLTVAALPSVAAVLLPRVIARFAEARPAVDVMIDDELSDSVLARVADGRADIGITIRPPPACRLSWRALLMDRFCLIAPASNVIERADWTMFKSRPFIAMSRTSSVRAATDAAFLQVGLPVTPLYECSHLATTGALVEEGLGLTALPQLAVQLLNNARLAAIPLNDPIIDRAVGVVTRTNRHESPAMTAFLRVITEEAALLRDQR